MGQQAEQQQVVQADRAMYREGVVALWCAIHIPPKSHSSYVSTSDKDGWNQLASSLVCWELRFNKHMLFCPFSSKPGK